MRIAIYQVDAFADGPFTGNPAAVCPLQDWLAKEVMQAIAAENNLSETAFLVPRREAEAPSYDLRWFTPLAEVDLCGHATLASGHVVLNKLYRGASAVEFHSVGAGVLRVVAQSGLLFLDLPVRAPWPAPELSGPVAEALGASPREVWRHDKLLALLDSQAAVEDVTPDFERIKTLPGDGLIVTAPGSAHDFVSRYFAPHVGIDEDPVTGSAHCVLMPFWSQRLGGQELRARQVSARGGELLCRLVDQRVHLGGRVVDYLEGTIEVPV